MDFSTRLASKNVDVKNVARHFGGEPRSGPATIHDWAQPWTSKRTLRVTFLVGFGGDEFDFGETPQTSHDHAPTSSVFLEFLLYPFFRVPVRRDVRKPRCQGLFLGSAVAGSGNRSRKKICRTFGLRDSHKNTNLSPIGAPEVGEKSKFRMVPNMVFSAFLKKPISNMYLVY